MSDGAGDSFGKGKLQPALTYMDRIKEERPFWDHVTYVLWAPSSGSLCESLGHTRYKWFNH